MKAFDLTFKYKNWKERELNWKIYYVVFAPFAIPFAILFRFLGLTPNVVTWTSILLQFPVIIFFAMGKPWIALLLMALAQVFDIVDGLLARYTGTSNKLQARFLDHIYHTLGVMAFLIGIGFAVN